MCVCRLYVYVCINSWGMKTLLTISVDAAECATAAASFVAIVS